MNWKNAYSAHRRKGRAYYSVDVMLYGAVICLFAGMVACTIQGWLS